MKFSIALVLVAFAALAFGWVTGQDVVLYASIACSAVAGLALLRSTLQERKAGGGAGRSKKRPAQSSDQPGAQRTKRKRRLPIGRRRRTESEKNQMFEPPPTVRTVRDPAEIARAQWPEQGGGSYVEGPGGSIMDFRSRLAAALDASPEADEGGTHRADQDLWADLEPEDVEEGDFSQEDAVAPAAIEPEDLSDLEEDDEEYEAADALSGEDSDLDEDEELAFARIKSAQPEESTLRAEAGIDDGEAVEADEEMADEEEEVAAAGLAVSRPSVDEAETRAPRGEDDEDDDVPIEWIPIEDLPQILRARRIGRDDADDKASSPAPSTRAGSGKAPTSPPRGGSRAKATRGKAKTTKAPSARKTSASDRKPRTRSGSAAAPAVRPRGQVRSKAEPEATALMEQPVARAAASEGMAEGAVSEDVAEDVIGEVAEGVVSGDVAEGGRSDESGEEQPLRNPRSPTAARAKLLSSAAEPPEGSDRRR